MKVKERRKFIASLTAVVVAIAMMPSLALAATTIPTKVTLVGSSALSDVTEANGAQYIVNAGIESITESTDDSITTIGFKMKSGEKLPYTHVTYDEAGVITGNFVALQFNFNDDADLSNGGRAYLSNKVTGQKDDGTYTYETGGIEITNDEVVLLPVTDTNLPVVKVMSNNTTLARTIKIDFSGLELETEEDYVPQAVLADSATLQKAAKFKKATDLDFVNKTVAITSTLNTSKSKSTAALEGYVAYKEEVSDATAGVVTPDGSYVAYSVKTGTLDKVADVANTTYGRSQGLGVYVTNANADNSLLVVQQVTDKMVKADDPQDLTLDVTRANAKTDVVNPNPQIRIDYSGLKLVNKDEAAEAKAAAKQILALIPDATNPDKDKVAAARAIYDTLSEAVQFQLQAMHEDAYKALTDAEAALNSTTDTTTPTNPSGDNGTTDNGAAVGSVVKVGGATYKVTSSKAVTFQKPKKNAKKVTIPATVKIKGKTYKVTAIAAKAFKGNKKVTKITVGKNVKTIGKQAFANTKNLKKIVIKSTKLTKKTVKKGAFKKVAKKVVLDVPNKKVKTYKKVFRQKGLPKACKIK